MGERLLCQRKHGGYHKANPSLTAKVMSLSHLCDLIGKAQLRITLDLIYICRRHDDPRARAGDDLKDSGMLLLLRSISK